MGPQLSAISWYINTAPNRHSAKHSFSDPSVLRLTSPLPRQQAVAA